MLRFRPAEILVIVCVAWSSHAMASGDAPAPGPSASPSSRANADCPPLSSQNPNGQPDLEAFREGHFCDDSYPLPLAAQHPIAPATPDVCSGQAAINGETPWQQGFRESLSGQRHALNIGGYRAEAPQERNPFRADRKACVQYRDGSHERELQCCISAFWKGLPVLASRLQALQDSPAGASPQELLCLDEYRRGFNQGMSICTAASGTCAIPHAYRYLGCYHLGRAIAAAQNCHDTGGDQIRETLRAQGVVYEGSSSRHDATPGASAQDPLSGEAGLH